MKKIFFFHVLTILVAAAASAQLKPANQHVIVSNNENNRVVSVINASITAQAGTKYFNAKHKAKAWLTNTPGKGLTLNFETDADVTAATIEGTDTPPYHNGSGTKQTTSFSTPVKKYQFYLDSPAYKGHKAYSLGLVTPDVAADAGLYWNCLVVRK